MDLYQMFDTNQYIADTFCDVLGDLIYKKTSIKANIEIKKDFNCIYFLMCGSTLLQAIPERYALHALYETEVEMAVKIIQKQNKRDYLINHIIKKES